MSAISCISLIFSGASGYLPLRISEPRKKLRHTSISADHGEVLVHGGDAVVRGTRAGEANVHLLPVDLQRALVVRVQPGHDLDQGRLAGAVVTEHAGHLAGVDRQVDALQRADRAVGLADVDHLDQRLALVQGRVGVFAAVVSVMTQPTFRVVESFLTYRFTMTASSSMTPRKALNQLGSQPA